MSSPNIGIRFNEFIIQNESILKQEIGLLEIYEKIQIACKKISTEVNRAGLADIIGKSHKENIHGEEVMKLDEIANDWLIEELGSSKYCAGVASEELDNYTPFPQNTNKEAQYVVLFDPLDGSSNIDTCASIGTIFSIYKRISEGELQLSDFLQKGTQVLSAGYVIYGSSTILVYSMGQGVHGFTLDLTENDYLLSHHNIKTPKKTNQFSLNYGNFKSFGSNIHDFVKWCCEVDKSTQRPYSLRYIGSMVADFHRNLIKGGIFIYPATQNAPNGKLRLTYECIPLSYIQEHAGGNSTNDSISILDIQPLELHQRTPVTVGSEELVKLYLSFNKSEN